MGPGVCAGATTIPQPAASKPGTSASASDGISSAAGRRAAEVTPRARTLPALINGSAGAGSANIKATCPPITSVRAGAARAIGQRSRMGFGVADQIGDGLDWQRGIDDQDKRNSGD